MPIADRRFTGSTRPVHQPFIARMGGAGTWAAGLAMLAAWLPAVAHGQLPAAGLYAIFPAGAQAGAQVEVTIVSSADLEGARELVFSDPRLTAVPKTQTVEGQAEPQPVPNQFVVSVAADAPPGLYDVRAVGTYGISNPRLFAVGTSPEAAEVEPNNQSAQATPVAPGSLVNGRVEPALDVDWFRLPAKAGERIVADLWAERIDSRLEARLELYDSAGRRVAVARDSFRHDATLDHVAGADGDYLLKVHDHQFAGSGEYFYRLAFGPVPQVEYVLPASGQPGTTSTVTVYGRNLPSGSPTDDVRLDGRPLDQLEVAVTWPGEPARLVQLEWAWPVRPAGALLDGLGLALATPTGPLTPAPIYLAEGPVSRESEPNDEPAQARAITVPGEVWGQFASPGDLDVYELEAAAGAVVWIEVFAGRLDRAVNPHLVVEQVTPGANGAEERKTLAELGIDPTGSVGPPSFDTTSDDFAYRLAAPAAGKYRLTLRNLFGESRADPRRIYRLIVRPETPDFRLVAVPEFPLDPAANANPRTTLVRAGGTDNLTLVALRRDGFGGEITVEAEGLPAGWTGPGVVIPAGRTVGHWVLSAAPGTPAGHSALRLLARAKLGDRELVREVRGATVVWSGNAALPPPTRLTREIMAAVAGEAPYSLTVGTSEATVVQSRLVELPLSAERRGEFAGALAVTGVDLPDKVANDTVNLPPDQTTGTLRLFVASDTPPGLYSIFAQTTTQVPFTKNADGSDKKPVNVLDYSLPVTLTVRPGPLVLAVAAPNNGQVKRGAQIELPVTITRRNEFAGPVTLALRPPPGTSGLAAAEVTIPPEATSGTLVVTAAADATEGNHAHGLVQARLTAGGEELVIDQPVPLAVVP